MNCESRSNVNGKTPEGGKTTTGIGGFCGSVGLKSSRSGKAGNHSEGYFSSDAEDDPAHPKLFVAKLPNSVKKGRSNYFSIVYIILN